jgi:ABC-type antimicrobial peptide transport system permease subunit
VAIVNETMAKHYWTAGDVIGSTVRTGDQRLRIVGVVADSKYRALTEAPMPHLYVPASQNYQSRLTLHFRTAADAAAVLPLVRAEAQRLDAGLVLSNVQTLRTHMGFATLVPRLSASLLGTFGAVALFLASLGVYSVVSFVIAARRRELGVRLAVGASSGSIRALVVGHGLRLAGWGIVAGLLLSVALGQLIANLLVGVSSVDVVALGSVTLLLLVVTVAASLVPALRASRLDVIRALRL